jgi:hypothetical protein
MRLLKVIGINVLVLSILVEITGWMLIEWKQPRIKLFEGIPTYLNLTREDVRLPLDLPECPHVVDTLLPWGVWHPASRRFHQSLPCADVTMEFNRLGTRGPIPDSSDLRNVLFLGDSFTEGWGIAEAGTIPAQFQQITGLPALNLGCMGIGTTQMSLIYRHFGPRFRHSTVVVLTYLFNDFTNNNIRFHSHPENYPDNQRYKPFRSDTSDLSKLVYLGNPAKSPFSWAGFRDMERRKKSKPLRDGWNSLLRRNDGSWLKSLSMLTYSRRLASWAVDIASNRHPPKIRLRELEYDEWDLKVLRYDMADIMRMADRNGAEVIFMNIPDPRILDASRKDERVSSDYRRLESLVSMQVTGGRHRFISFFDHALQQGINGDQIRLPCENHYNELGDQLVAEFISKAKLSGRSDPSLTSLR